MGGEGARRTSVSKRMSGVFSAARASLKKATRYDKSADLHGPEDNQVVRYRGVSLAFLKALRDNIVADRQAPGVVLAVLVEDAGSRRGGHVVPGGATVRVLEELPSGRVLCSDPRAGEVEVAGWDALRRLERHEWTVEHVCEYVVQQETRAARCFYLDVMEPEHVGARFQGAFVSQARKSRFSDLVDSLVRRHEKRVTGKRGKRETYTALGKQFIWLDIFSANQPLLTRLDLDCERPDEVRAQQELLLKRGLHDAIRLFQERLIYFNSWASPLPLSRAWCVWEIFGMVKSGKGMDLVFRPGESEAFVDTLLEDRSQVAHRVMDIKLEDAQCFSSKDKRDIDAAVAREADLNGYHTLNVRVSALLNKWLGGFTRDAVDKAKRLRGGVALGRVHLQAGGFFHDLGHLDPALRQFEQALNLFEQAHGGRTNLDVANTIRGIADIHRHKGDYDAALGLLQEVARIKEQIGGPEDLELASTYHDVAIVLEDTGDYNAALTRYQEELRIYDAAHGGDRDNPSVAQALQGIASVLFNHRGDFSSALVQLQEVLGIRERAHGRREHPDVAFTLHSIARIHDLQGEFDAALELYEEILKYAEQGYGGREHANVAVLLSNMACALINKGDFERALTLYEEVATINERLHHDRTHPNYAAALIGQGTALCRMHRTDRGIELIQQARAILKKKPNLELMCRASLALGSGLRIHGVQMEYARTMLEDALERTFHHFNRDATHPRLAPVRYELALVQATLGDVERAYENLLAAERCYRQHLANPTDDHSRIKEILVALDALPPPPADA